MAIGEISNSLLSRFNTWKEPYEKSLRSYDTPWSQKWDDRFAANNEWKKYAVPLGIVLGQVALFRGLPSFLGGHIKILKKMRWYQKLATKSEFQVRRLTLKQRWSEGKSIKPKNILERIDHTWEDVGVNIGISWSIELANQFWKGDFQKSIDQFDASKLDFMPAAYFTLNGFAYGAATKFFRPWLSSIKFGKSLGAFRMEVPGVDKVPIRMLGWTKKVIGKKVTRYPASVLEKVKWRSWIPRFDTVTLKRGPEVGLRDVLKSWSLVNRTGPFISTFRPYPLLAHIGGSVGLNALVSVPFCLSLIPVGLSINASKEDSWNYIFKTGITYFFISGFRNSMANRLAFGGRLFWLYLWSETMYLAQQFFVIEDAGAHREKNSLK